MGVHGLWRLIEPSGKPVPLETLEDKVLAVDVSIWLHHFIKGFQDSKGAPVPNAHLLGIYHRVCKLLYFRIKPVFVFDGGVPVLKRETIAKRNQQKSKNLAAADRIHKNLLSALVKHSALSKILSEQAKVAITSTSPTKSKNDTDDLYMLPPSQSLEASLSSGDDSSSAEDSPSKHYDLHSIDTHSVQFKSLPVDIRHEILTDLKDTRKQSSWGRIHELPVESDDFAVYQMKRLLNRQSVQSALEEVEKEMGGHSLSLQDLEKILKDQGIITTMKGSRIASDENTRFFLIKDIKQALEDAKKQNGLTAVEDEIEKSEEEVSETMRNKGEVEFEEDLKRAIAMSLEETPSTSTAKETVEELSSTSEIPVESKQMRKMIGGKGKNRMPLSFLENVDDADFDDSSSEEDEIIASKLTPAQRYMMEYSGLTPSEIAKIVASKSKSHQKIGRAMPIKKIDVIDIVSSSGGDSVGVEVTVPKKLANVENDLIEVEVAEPENAVDKSQKVGASNVEKKDEIVAVMSESEGDDDFVDVMEVSPKKKVVDSMEIVIKPDEGVEDDLFKDVFADDDKREEKEPEVAGHIIEKEREAQIQAVSSTVEVVEEVSPNHREATSSTIEKVSPNHREATSSKIEKVISTLDSSQKKQSSVKDKINKMIKNYTTSEVNNETETPKISTEQITEMRENIRREEAELLAERSSRERLAGNITDQMCKEAQELLELFGVPYLVAPMEAEAQCAFLDLMDLTDGSITDDSDIWLFGGKTVYKNFFNQSKIVQEFKSEQIELHFKLTREQMILLAMLVGSDYTTGLTGVGPVTALEILAAFPPKNQLVSGLAEFRSWCNKGKQPGPGRTSLRGKLKNLSFFEGFPNVQIAQAYLTPTVETSEEKFSWAKPDVGGLVDFARRKFGWKQGKTEDILNPILRRLEDTRKQKTIRDYFNVQVNVSVAEHKMSKRVKAAINKIGKVGNEEEEPKTKKKRPTKNKGVTREPKPRKTKLAVDEEIELLKQIETSSKKRVEEIHDEVQKEVDRQELKKVNIVHKTEIITQRQKDKSDMLKNKLKAIETFRKSKQGPGFLRKRKKTLREPQKDAGYLSGSNSD